MRSRAAHRGHASRFINENNDAKVSGTMDDAKKLELESIKQKILKQKTREARDKDIENLIVDKVELDEEILVTSEFMDKIADALTEIVFELTSTHLQQDPSPVYHTW